VCLLLRAAMVIAGVRRRVGNDVGVTGQGSARDDAAQESQGEVSGSVQI
jgi:hypothetical protein